MPSIRPAPNDACRDVGSEVSLELQIAGVGITVFMN